jgi:hypothetical protein
LAGLREVDAAGGAALFFLDNLAMRQLIGDDFYSVKILLDPQPSPPVLVSLRCKD